MRIPEHQEYQKWIKKMLTSWSENYGGRREKVFHLHDPLAIYSIYYPQALKWKTSGVEVLQAGKERGQMIINPAHPPCQIALGVNKPSSISRELFEIVFSEN